MLACALLAGKITLSVPQLLIMSTVMVLGTVPFAAIGLFIGTFASGSSAPAYANIIFLPMLWLSGLFILLPKFLEAWAVIWPAFHLNQVALGAAGVSEYSFVAPQICCSRRIHRPVRRHRHPPSRSQGIAGRPAPSRRYRVPNWRVAHRRRSTICPTTS
jgi:hypothetical protein